MRPWRAHRRDQRSRRRAAASARLLVAVALAALSVCLAVAVAPAGSAGAPARAPAARAGASHRTGARRPRKRSRGRRKGSAAVCRRARRARRCRKASLAPPAAPSGKSAPSSPSSGGSSAGATGALAGGSSGSGSAAGGSSETGETSESLANGSEPLRLFSASSVFNEQLPASTPLAGDSAQLVDAFLAQVSSYYGHVVMNTTEWSTPVYVVGANAPTTALVGESSICSRPEGVFSGFQEQIEAVPIPANAQPAAGSDKELVIWQPSTGHLWELWRALREGGHWTACWGGEIQDAYTSDGVFPAPFGAGASGLSLLGGQIHLEDLEHGAIDHALEVLVPETKQGEFVWPADRTDGVSSGPDAIPEGTRFRLSPSLDLASLHLSPAALEIATAIQRYGMFVADTGGAVALSAQDPTPLIDEGRPNPYDTLLSTDPDDVLDAIPWSELEAVSPGYRG